MTPNAADAPTWLPGVSTQAGQLLGLLEPLRLPTSFITLVASGVDVITLDPTGIPTSRSAAPQPEFGALGRDMPAYFIDYEFAQYLPGAWPLALDGGGGFYCLDLRDVVAGRAPNDGTVPLVWSHAGSLGWGPDEHIRVAADADGFLAGVSSPLVGPTSGPILTLQDVLADPAAYAWGSALYGPRDNAWAADTVVIVHDVDDVDEDTDLTTQVSAAGFDYVLDLQTVGSIVANARQQRPGATRRELLSAFQYYVRTDAFIVW